MAIAFRASNVGISANFGSTYSVTKPTGTVDGDILIAALAIDAGTATTATWPSGWTLIRYDNDGGSFTMGLEVRYRVASGEGASWSWTSSGVDSLVAVLCYSGGDTTTPVDVNNGGPAASGSLTCNAPSVTPGFADDFLVCCYAADKGSATASTITLDGTLTSRINSISAGNLIRLAVGDKQLASAAATGNIAATMSATADVKVGQQIGLKTAAAAAGRVPYRQDRQLIAWRGF